MGSSCFLISQHSIERVLQTGIIHSTGHHLQARKDLLMHYNKYSKGSDTSIILVHQLVRSKSADSTPTSINEHFHFEQNKICDLHSHFVIKGSTTSSCCRFRSGPVRLCPMRVFSGQMTRGSFLARRMTPRFSSFALPRSKAAENSVFANGFARSGTGDGFACSPHR